VPASGVVQLTVDMSARYAFRPNVSQNIGQLQVYVSADCKFMSRLIASLHPGYLKVCVLQCGCQLFA
jgi:hypothetical protein